MLTKIEGQGPVFGLLVATLRLMQLEIEAALTACDDLESRMDQAAGEMTAGGQESESRS